MFNNVFKKREKIKTGRWYTRGPLTGILFAAIMLYICSLLLSKEIIPSQLMSECVIASVFIGTSVGGAVAARSKREGVLTAGVLTGLIVLGVIVLATILRPTGKVLSDTMLKMAICTVGGGTFGGAMCLNRSGGKKHKRTAAIRRK
ncbi:MAG TPA: TIGR04086 family membrane protein [Clostridiales bacterium]|jgi:putative membrane protein (TIGR04086 family)|nr:TIGR04086 family membrane protein [Clostridiales bacterium]